MKSLKRGLLILGVAVVLLAVLFAFRWWQISAQREAMSAPPPPAAVEQVRAEPRSWPASLSAIGELRAVNGVRVANEIAGVVEELAFESGQRVEAGDMLLRLDAETDEAALETRQAEARLARQQFERFSDLVDQSAVSRA
ncbi:MAG: biotin/lipoyl-binding protein, partial [Wenzhouxiangellaceae bacterium]|nr:biotin/lipoyl-binding protein [Wenzhouxiangellaceae bacterium]